jgi:hypothetical protein
MTDLDERIRTVVRDLLGAAPAPPDFPAGTRHRRVRPLAVVAAVGAVAAMIAVLAVLVPSSRAPRQSVTVTAPPTTPQASGVILSGTGTLFARPPSSISRPYDSAKTCVSLIDPGWSGTCGLIALDDARAIWVAESTDPHSYTDTRAVVWRLSPDNHDVSMLIRQDEGGALLQVATIDLGGGASRVAFVTHPVGMLRGAVLDVVSVDGKVEAHLELSYGAVRVNPRGASVTIEAWGYATATEPPYVHDSINYVNGAWEVIRSTPASPTSAPIS